MEIILPLEYSGFHFILRDDAALSIDFPGRKWTLHNVRKYAPNGDLLLDDNRYGLCAELSAYTFQKLKPLFEGHYEIKFARASEPGFFDAPQSSHIILVIVNRSGHGVYLLDPSFHLYSQGPGLDRYVLFETKDELASIKAKNPDISFPANDMMPLIIRKDHLLFFSIEPVNGKFDRNNLTLSIAARQRYQPSGVYLLALKKQGDAVDWFFNKPLSEKLLTPDEEQLIRKKMIAWMNAV